MEITRTARELKYSLAPAEADSFKKFYSAYGLTTRESARVFGRQSGSFYAYDGAQILRDVIAESDLDPAFYIDDINRPIVEISSEGNTYGIVVNLSLFRIISPLPYTVYAKVPTAAFALLAKAAQVVYDEVFDYTVAKISFNITRVK